MRLPWYPVHDGFVPTSVPIEPELSTTIMKYGFEGAGHCEGSGDRHAAGSCACASRVAATSVASDASPASPTDLPKTLATLEERNIAGWLPGETKTAVAPPADTRSKPPHAASRFHTAPTPKQRRRRRAP